MVCDVCRGPAYDTTVELDYPGLGVVAVPAIGCLKCDEKFCTGEDLEESEKRLSKQLFDANRTDPRAIRYMRATYGVMVDEIYLRFPYLTPEEVKGWRHGVGTVPEEVVTWVYGIVANGGLTDSCRCGQCG